VGVWRGQSRASRCCLLAALTAAAAYASLALGGCAPPVSSTATTAGSTTASVGATAAAATSPTPAAQPATVTPKVAKREGSSAKPVAVPGDNTSYEWNFQRNTRHKVPEIPSQAKKLAKRYSAMYVASDNKLVYLTFDESYENGNTPDILDTLKHNGVSATFFVTGDYCREAPKLCRRMIAEGHVVGSHSDKHPSMPKLTSNPTRFAEQFTRADSSFRKATGEHLAHLFRPPMGAYSAKSLAMTRNLGYTSVFWSFAHVDYDEKHQPPAETTLKRVLAGSHPGAIILLHGISASDTSALEDIIIGLRRQGYGFGTLRPR